MLINHDFTDRLHYTFQHDYAFQDQHPLLLGKTAHWYGINNFLTYDVRNLRVVYRVVDQNIGRDSYTYDINDDLKAGIRAEWFRDHDGVRVLESTRGGALNGSSGYYAITGGVNWKPVGWLTIRPEVRYDWADKAKAFDAGTRKDQYTFSTDMIVNF